MNSRTRNSIIIFLVLALLGGSVAVILIKKTRQGLDLAGGIELVYRAIPNDPNQKLRNEDVQTAIETIRKRVNALGVSEAEIQNVGSDLIDVALPNVADPKRAQEQVGSTAQLFFYKWENNIVVGPGLSKDNTSQQAASNTPYTSLFDAVKVASTQKPSTPGADQDNDGIKSAKFYLFNKKSKKPYFATKEDEAAAINKNESYPTEKGLLSKYDGKQPPNTEIMSVPRGVLVVIQPNATTGKFTKDAFWVIRDNVGLNGKEVKGASSTIDQTQGPAVDLTFTGTGGKIFERITREMRKEGEKEIAVTGNRDQFAHRFAIVLDGEIISLANISITDPDLAEGIAGGRAQITGLKVQESQDLARNIELGALPLQLELISQNRVSATLGKQALDEALIAAAVGLGLVLLFLLIFYRVLGVIAGVALVTYGALFFAMSKLIGVTFTLPGIAGMVLTLSVAADANIVIFERIKEEVRAGRSIASSISTGYSKGFRTILDANIVTLITAFILFVLATSGVRGFAASLGLGTIVSLFTAVVATSAILGLISHWRVLERPSALGAGEQRARWHFDFIGKSRWFFSMSGVILAIGALAIAGLGLNLGIDFESGTRIKAGLDKPATEAQIRTVFSQIDAGEAKIQRIVGDKILGANAFQISSETLKPQDVTKVNDLLDQRFSIKGSGNDQQFEQVSVGPTFGSAVARSAVIALIFSLLVIGIYITLRFAAKFSIPVMIALMHDILITIGVYSLVGREMTSATVAAMLTILGFSLYDTIIVFDRIRENLPRMPRAAFSQIVNRSMSEVLTRSLATSFVTALPVSALMIFGGETLRDFAFALLIGTISGTYSSIFIASPVLSHWKEREPIFRQRRERIASENNGVVPAYFVDTVGGVAVAHHHEEHPVVLKGEDADTTLIEEIDEDVPIEDEPPTNGGPAARPTTKDERRAARQRRKHGRTR